ncbi:MAG: Ig-like domain-containing protein [Thermoflexales bacterium]
MKKRTFGNPPGLLRRLVAAGSIGLFTLTACLGGAAKTPEIKITAPEPNAQLSVGQSIAIVGTATGDAISRVDVIIDGTTYATLNAPDKSKGVPSFPINVPWTPLSAGKHAIQLKAYGPPDDKLLTQSEPLVLVAQAAAVAESPAAPEPTQPVAIPTQAPPPPTAAPSQPQPTPNAGAATGQQPAPSDAGAPSLTVTNEFVNVRTGPDVVYAKIGELKQGEVAPVRGKSADGRWWQIAYPSGPGGVGWVINDYVQANSAAANVPVAAAPPRPTSPPVVVQPPATPVLVPIVTLPPQPTAPPQGQLVGDKGVLRVNANPVPSGATVFASWNIPNFKSGEFDRGDGQGYRGPVAQVMQVDVPAVIGPRTIRLRWVDLNNQVFEDSITINVVGQNAPITSGYPDCNPSNPDWQANKPGNPSNWTFCKRKDPEYVGESPGNIAYVPRSDKLYTMAWEVYGARAIYLVFEPNSSRGPAGPLDQPNLSRPTTGTGPLSFRSNEFADGCYKITLRIDTNAGDRADFGEKFFCVNVSPSGGGGGGGGGGGSSPTATPGPTPIPSPTPMP